MQRRVRVFAYNSGVEVSVRLVYHLCILRDAIISCSCSEFNSDCLRR